MSRYLLSQRNAWTKKTPTTKPEESGVRSLRTQNLGGEREREILILKLID